MKKITPTILLIFSLLLLMSPSALPDVPKVILYQGTLTDSSGLPVPNNTYFVRFIIWNDSISTSPTDELWNSNIQTFNIVDGLLEAQLGAASMPPLADSIFTGGADRYLGITVGTDPELSPRITFTAVPYALQALSSDTARIAISVDYNSVTGASIVDGSIELTDLGQNSAATGNVIKWDGSQWTVQPPVSNDGITSVHIAPGAVGSSQIATGAVTSVEIAAAAVTTSELANSSVGTSEIINNSILGVDIIDEPGIVQGRSSVTVSLNSSGMVDLVSLTITTPAAGFIFLQGRARIKFNSDLVNFAYMQIDENQGGGLNSGIYSQVGMSTFPSTGPHFFDCSSQRTYFKSAGTHTFRLEAMQAAISTIAQASFPVLTAIYFPTSYGSVVTLTGESSHTITKTKSDRIRQEELAPSISDKK